MKKILLFGAALMMAAVSMAQTPTVSTSSVTFKYCQTTDSVVHVSAKENMFPFSRGGVQFTSFGTYVNVEENARGCDSIVTYLVERNTQGRLPGRFTINANGDQVYFSKGNLMYLAYNGTSYPNAGCLSHATNGGGTAPGIWKFGDTQYASCGNTAANRCPNANMVEWIDFFGQGSSGYNNVVPTSRYSCQNKSGIGNSNYDWGVYNAISNGGDLPDVWRTMSRTEFLYIIQTRANASSKRSMGTVAGVVGLILLPDNWTLPEGLSFNANNYRANSNVYTADQWRRMEANGAVFLVVDMYTGTYCASNSSHMYDSEVFYRTSDGSGVCIYRNNSSVFSSLGTFNYEGYYYAAHVRLVCDVVE